MNTPAFDFMQAPGRRDDLADLAAAYHQCCEEFDRTVCTGRTDSRGVVRPADARELAIINRRARTVFAATLSRAEALGYSHRDLQHAIGKAA